MTGCTVRRYDQLETSPETIEQELQHAVCERRQTDIQTDLWRTRPVPVEGKSSVCLICMKYRIIMLIIIIISMGKISLSYIANTSRTHARMHARTHTHAHTREHAHPNPTTTVAVRSVGAPNHDTVMVGRPLFDAGQTMPVAGHSLTDVLATRFHRGFWSFSRTKKMLGRTET